MPRVEEQAPGGFGIPEAAALVGWSAARVRRLVRDGVLVPSRGPRGTLRLSFRDLALLRRLRELGGSRVPARRVRGALARLRASMPDAGALTQMTISAAGREVVVRDDSCLWSPESGQCCFDFAPPARRRVVDFAARVATPGVAEDALAADDWVRLGCDFEPDDPARAREAYCAALALDPTHADAHVNLGCLEHEAGRLASAEAHYRAALAARPDDAVARFDLAVALEDQGRLDAAREAYEDVTSRDPRCAEAHHNLARVCERQGDRAAALRHWGALRRLVLDGA